MGEIAILCILLFHVGSVGILSPRLGFVLLAFSAVLVFFFMEPTEINWSDWPFSWSKFAPK